MHSIILFILYTAFIFELPGLDQKCDIEIINKGIGGNTTTDLIGRVEIDVFSENPDMVILMIGTNDMVNSRKMISIENYSSNLNKLIQRLKENNIDVVSVSPPPVDSVYLFQRHARELFMEAPNKKLEKISEILKEKALEKDLSFVDIFTRFSEMGIPIHNQDKVIRNVFNSGSADGVHSTPVGYQLIAQEIFNVLVIDGKIKRHIKIVCLGDSITFGAHVAGEGTASGETYPAYLNELICSYLKNNE
jgi:lysophospholipase L1-like esterase